MAEATYEQASWFNDLQKVSTSPENVAKIQEITSYIDVLDRLSKIDTPTLVLHAVGDQRVPYKQGRELASLISGAKLVDLNSNNHLLIKSEPAWKQFQAAVRKFLGTGPSVIAEPSPKPTERPPDGLTPHEV